MRRHGRGLSGYRLGELLFLFEGGVGLVFQTCLAVDEEVLLVERVARSAGRTRARGRAPGLPARTDCHGVALNPLNPIVEEADAVGVAAETASVQEGPPGVEGPLLSVELFSATPRRLARFHHH